MFTAGAEAPVTAAVVEQACTQRRTVETRGAQPVNGAVTGNERGRAEVGQQRIVGDGLSAHGSGDSGTWQARSSGAGSVSDKLSRHVRRGAGDGFIDGDRTGVRAAARGAWLHGVRRRASRGR